MTDSKTKEIEDGLLTHIKDLEKKSGDMKPQEVLKLLFKKMPEGTKKDSIKVKKVIKKVHFTNLFYSSIVQLKTSETKEFITSLKSNQIAPLHQYINKCFYMLIHCNFSFSIF